MPSTPTTRSTRSGSSTTSISLNDIKSLIDDKMKDLTKLIEKTRSEIIQTFRSDLEELRQTMSEVKVDVLELQKSNELLKKKNHYIENELIEIKQHQTNAVHEIIHEVEERERRKLNLVISGLPEPVIHDDDCDDESIQNDRHNCDLMLRSLNITEADGITVHRIGRARQGDRPRLLKLKCNNIEQKITILRKARELRSHQRYREVYINPDRTHLQQIIHKSLRDELKHRKDAGEDVVIFRDRVVVRRSRPNRHF